MPTAAIVSYRLGGGDGVSVEAGKWSWALAELGFAVYTVAGSGRADCLVPALAMDAGEPPERHEVESALSAADLVVAENICSLPLNPSAGTAVANACRGRPALLHHHDLPWQRPQLSASPPPPDDPRWRHVTINALSQRQLERRGINAVTIYNAFDPDPPAGDRVETRRRLGVEDRAWLLLQPTRALYRKNVPGGVATAERLGATYWLWGPPEDGFGPHLERILEGARCPVRLGRCGRRGEKALDGCSVADAFAACDAVVLPSIWEGFGNPAVEAAVYGRPLATGPFPVARELEAFGFRWFTLASSRRLAGWLQEPDDSLITHNLEVARRHFSLYNLPARVAQLLHGLLG